MSTECWIGTRKGLIKLDRCASGDWVFSPPRFMGEAVSMVLPPDADGVMYASLSLGHFGPKLHRSDDAGENWQEISTPAFPKTEKEEDAKSVELVWVLERGQDDCLWAGTVPAGMFKSEDQGMTWIHMASLNAMPGSEEWFGGGFDEPGVHSIQIDPRDKSKITIAISCGGVCFSADNGETWVNKAKGMRAEYVPPEQAGNENTQDPHRLIACPANPDRLWVQHHNGIFRFDEKDGTWTEIHNATPSNFGFALAVHPNDGDTAWFVPAMKDEYRIPVDNKLVVSRTRDGGASFEEFGEGLPTEHSYDLVYRHCLEIDAEGKMLMMGSTSGNLWVSYDAAESWTSLSTNLADIYCVKFRQL